MDTGASSHLTNNAGTIKTPSTSRINSSILVGNGSCISVVAKGSSNIPVPLPPLALNNILYAPQIIKNLVSVRKFTKDNHVSIRFDPLGFSVKDLHSGSHVMRCNSSGDLYPLCPSSSTSSSSQVSLAAISSGLWHNRLGHPGPSVLQYLSKNKSIQCNKEPTSTFCYSCQTGKHVRLPFFSSQNVTSAPFDIIHSDLWTSPVLSKEGHRYYLLFLDDFTNYLWVSPLKYKSQVFDTFLALLLMSKINLRDI